jgi:hypothetical protein
MRKTTDIKIRCNDIEQQLKEWGKVPTNSEDTNLLHKVNNLYRELGDKPEVQRLMTLYPINQLYTKWGGHPLIQKNILRWKPLASSIAL